MVVHGDSLEYLKQLPDNSIDSVVTDPPYGISFMSKGWDTFNGNKQYAEWVERWARECLRVLKPGGHLLAFSGTRTYHALAWGVESAGFEIRDMIEWLYLSGFPKSMDVGKQFDKMAGVEREVVGHSMSGRRKQSTWNPDGKNSGVFRPNDDGYDVTAPATPLAKQWDGWGTALKPAHEPIVMARKPLNGTVCANVEQHGTGAINVDGCRIGATDDLKSQKARASSKSTCYGEYGTDAVYTPNDAGRFPANCITTNDDEWYSKYFNVTPQEISKKASKKDRNSTWAGGSITATERVTTDGRKKPIDNPFNRGETLRQNHHPTVKPVALMEWLVTLVTPPGGTVLDPFAGSGTTLVAAKRLGLGYIGIERDEEYSDIIRQRLCI